MHSYWTGACGSCSIKSKCTTSKERRIRRWEHEAILERVQQRFDENPEKVALRSKTVEHPFGTIKTWMGAAHFKMKTLKHVATEMALHVLAYNMTRVMAILGVPDSSRRCGRNGVSCPLQATKGPLRGLSNTIRATSAPKIARTTSKVEPPTIPAPFSVQC